jgi:hypothetical protein
MTGATSVDLYIASFQSGATNDAEDASRFSKTPGEGTGTVCRGPGEGTGSPA